MPDCLPVGSGFGDGHTYSSQVEWRVVAALNGDGERRQAGQARGVDHLVREDIRERIGGSPQGLNGRVRVVETMY